MQVRENPKSPLLRRTVNHQSRRVPRVATRKPPRSARRNPDQLTNVASFSYVQIKAAKTVGINEVGRGTDGPSVVGAGPGAQRKPQCQSRPKSKRLRATANQGEARRDASASESGRVGPQGHLVRPKAAAFSGAGRGISQARGFDAEAEGQE